MKATIELVFLLFIIIIAATTSIAKIFDIAILNYYVELFTTEYQTIFILFIASIAAYAFYKITFHKKELSFIDKLQYNLGLCFFILFIYLVIKENSG